MLVIDKVSYQYHDLNSDCHRVTQSFQAPQVVGVEGIFPAVGCDGKEQVQHPVPWLGPA